jgi:hypothetical protein
MAQQWIDALDSLALRMRAAGREPLGYRPDGRAIWPIFGASEPPPAPPAPTPPAPPAPPAPPSDPGFPANTPTEQMTAEQRANYWQFHARKHEDRNKALGGITPEQLADIQAKAAKHDALELELGTTADKAAAQARQEAEQAVRAQIQPLLAETAFRVAIGDRKSQTEVDEFIADLNLPRFLTNDGKVDTAKVLARVEQFAPAMGNQQQQRKGPTVTGHGSGSGASGGGLSGLSGSELFDRLHPKKNSA